MVTQMRTAATETMEGIRFWICFEYRADETAVVNNMGCERKI